MAQRILCEQMGEESLGAVLGVCGGITAVTQKSRRAAVNTLHKAESASCVDSVDSFCTARKTNE
jgi:hypothetical protein